MVAVRFVIAGCVAVLLGACSGGAARTGAADDPSPLTSPSVTPAPVTPSAVPSTPVTITPPAAPTTAVPVATKPPPPPVVDPACKEDVTNAGLCRFVLAVQAGKLSTLSAEERRVAMTAKTLPKGAWTVGVCDLFGDITVRCEIRFTGVSSTSSKAAAGFNLQPVNGSYNVQTGGFDVNPGATLAYEVIEYLGLGPAGSFEPS